MKKFIHTDVDINIQMKKFIHADVDMCIQR